MFLASVNIILNLSNQLHKVREILGTFEVRVFGNEGIDDRKHGRTQLYKRVSCNVDREEIGKRGLKILCESKISKEETCET